MTYFINEGFALKLHSRGLFTQQIELLFLPSGNHLYFMDFSFGFLPPKRCSAANFRFLISESQPTTPGLRGGVNSKACVTGKNFSSWNIARYWVLNSWTFIYILLSIQLRLIFILMESKSWWKVSNCILCLAFSFPQVFWWIMKEYLY